MKNGIAEILAVVRVFTPMNISIPIEQDMRESQQVRLDITFDHEFQWVDEFSG